MHLQLTFAKKDIQINLDEYDKTFILLPLNYTGISFKASCKQTNHCPPYFEIIKNERKSVALVFYLKLG